LYLFHSRLPCLDLEIASQVLISWDIIGLKEIPELLYNQFSQGERDGVGQEFVLVMIN
jgi:hypothetical protein